MLVAETEALGDGPAFSGPSVSLHFPPSSVSVAQCSQLHMPQSIEIEKNDGTAMSRYCVHITLFEVPLSHGLELMFCGICSLDSKVPSADWLPPLMVLPSAAAPAPNHSQSTQQQSTGALLLGNPGEGTHRLSRLSLNVGKLEDYCTHFKDFKIHTGMWTVL